MTPEERRIQENIQIGTTIKVLITAARMTQNQLAAHTGYGPSIVSLIINGERTPTVEFLIKTAKALQIPVSAMLYNAVIYENPGEIVQNELKYLETLFGIVVADLQRRNTPKARRSR